MPLLPSSVAVLVSIHAPHAGGDRCRCLRRSTSARFNPRPPRGGRRAIGSRHWWRGLFQSTPPTRGATAAGGGACVTRGFNPRPPRGGRRYRPSLRQSAHRFNPRPPRGGRQRVWADGLKSDGFQSTPPTRGATKPAQPSQPRSAVSIHAPHAGGDFWRCWHGERSEVSIHAPHAGGDAMRNSKPRGLLFQSTPPTRGAT